MERAREGLPGSRVTANAPARCGLETNVAGILEVSKGDEVVDGDLHDGVISRAWSSYPCASSNDM
jgi:hypothetical protein